MGVDYTEEAIRRRIENGEKDNSLGTEQDGAFKASEILNKKQKDAITKKKPLFQKQINLFVDISKNIRTQQSNGYEQALVRSNINTLVKTMNFLIEHKLKTSDDFQVYAEGKRAEYSLCRKDIGKLENELLDLFEKIKFTQNYKKNAAIFFEAKRNKSKEFYREHEEEIVLFKASEIYFKRKQLNPKEMNLSEMYERYKMLKNRKDSID